MRLESLLALTQGTLLNQPTIHSISSIQSRANKVSRGDLYLDSGSEEELNEALKRGAYAVITERDKCTICDHEIAFIRVCSVQEAELKLLRFHLLPKKLTVYHAAFETLEYIEQLLKFRSSLAIITEQDKLFKILWSIHEGALLLVPTQKEFLDLFPMAQSIEHEIERLKLKPLSPFESYFYDGEHAWGRIKIPEPLYSHFKRAYTFIKEHGLELNIHNLNFINSFFVQSFNTYFEPKEFGKGSKTLIFIKDHHLASNFFILLQKRVPWAKILYLSDASYREIGYNKPIIYKDQKSFEMLIQNELFDYGVILAQTPPEVPLYKKPAQMRLF